MMIKSLAFLLLCGISASVVAAEPYDRIAPLVEKSDS